MTINRKAVNQTQDHFDVSIVSGLKTSDELINTGSSVVTGLLVYTDGSNDATCTVYDNTEGSGKVITKFIVKGSELYGGVVGVRWAANTGVYITISGTGSSANLYYMTARHI